VDGVRLGRRSIALVVGAVLIALAVPHAAVRADEVPDAGCSVAGGALSIGSADNGDGDFTVFGLFDANGERLARQYIPIYNPDASAELMLTPVGSGATVHSVKCLAEESLRRCNDPQWEPIDEGVVVQLNGFLLGADYAIVSAKGRYKSAEGAPAISLDGTALGFVLDEQPVEWTALYDSRDQGSVAFFAIAHGEHKLTLGARDPSTQAFLPEERVCFRT
jgi:hypothetical protein